MQSTRALWLFLSVCCPSSLFVSGAGLTTEEISQFNTTGNFGARVTVLTEDARVFYIVASGLPDHETERVNPNSATNQNYNVSILKDPEIVSVPGCVGLGMIGITRTGVAIYNPLAGDLSNAVEGASPEVFDKCDGHASPNGAYHYHKIPDSCLYRGDVDEFIGVALDGFAIYGPRISETENVTEAELDKCHGKFVNGSYRYYVTDRFPYYLGCFKGRVVNPGTLNQNNCTSNTSHWTMENYGYSYYLCHCVNSGMGGGGGPRPECAPENPNRPPDCPLCPPEGCRSTTMLSNPTTTTTTTTTTISPTPGKDDAAFNHSSHMGLSTEEISQFETTGNYGARVEVLQGDSRVFYIVASGLPDHETERVNPNSASNQNYNVSILKDPEILSVPGCVGLGMIGITRTGVAIYNPLAGDLSNAVEGASPEVFDKCDGHASPNGAYHYHKIPDSCLYRGDVDEFIGVALDGFPIYGPRLSETENVTEAELDKCHGKFVNGSYRYYVTDRFPYYLGCFKGRVVNPGTLTQNNCTSNTSHWTMENYGYSYYLCHCVNSGMGGGGPGGGGGPRPECAPENPNRPPDCPLCPREGCRSTPNPNMTGLDDGSNDAGHVVFETLTLVPLLLMTCLMF